MDIYTFYTPSHIDLFNLFSESLKKTEKLNVLVEKFPQECGSGSYMSEGWGETMKKKTNLIIEAIDKGEIFIHSDSDIIFLKDPVDEILQELGDYDLAFQSDSVLETWYCMGFFICRPSKRVKELFLRVFENIDRFQGNDQLSLNNILSTFQNSDPGQDFKDLKYKLLSNKFFTFGLTNPDKPWTGEDFEIPSDIITFHANWTVGIENKIHLIKKVIEKYEMKNN